MFSCYYCFNRCCSSSEDVVLERIVGRSVCWQPSSDASNKIFAMISGDETKHREKSSHAFPKSISIKWKQQAPPEFYFTKTKQCSSEMKLSSWCQNIGKIPQGNFFFFPNCLRDFSFQHIFIFTLNMLFLIMVPYHRQIVRKVFEEFDTHRT